MRKSTIILSIALTVLAFLISCNVGNNAIFYTLENEKKITDNTLPNNIDVTGMVRYGDYYYVSAGSIYRASVSGGNSRQWSKITNNDSNNESPGLLNALIAFNNRYFASFFKDKTDGTISYGLYSTAALDTSTTWDGPLGSASDILSKQVAGLFDVNGNLIVCIYSDKAYHAFYSTDGTNFSQITFTGLSSGLPQKIVDIAYFNGNYWILTGSKIYEGTGIGTLTEMTSYPTTGNVQYRGVLATSSTSFSPSSLFITDSAGEIFYTSNGTTWNKLPDSPVKVSTKTVPFGKLIEISDNLLLVGTNGYGFYKISSTGTGGITRYSDNTKTELYNAFVLDFFLDNTAGTVFTLTAGSGLWSNPINNISSDSSWQWE